MDEEEFIKDVSRLAQEVHDILKILNMIGALVVKPNQDPEKCNYKVALAPEGFRFRIRKQEETIRLYQSKQAQCGYVRKELT